MYRNKKHAGRLGPKRSRISENKKKGTQMVRNLDTYEISSQVRPLWEVLSSILQYTMPTPPNEIVDFMGAYL